MGSVPKPIFVPPGTRLHMIVRRDDHWEVWTATDKRDNDSRNWRGTYIALHDNGEAHVHTRLADEEKDYRVF